MKPRLLLIILHVLFVIFDGYPERRSGIVRGTSQIEITAAPPCRDSLYRKGIHIARHCRRGSKTIQNRLTDSALISLPKRAVPDGAPSTTCCPSCPTSTVVPTLFPDDCSEKLEARLTPIVPLSMALVTPPVLAAPLNPTDTVFPFAVLVSPAPPYAARILPICLYSLLLSFKGALCRFEIV